MIFSLLASSKLKNLAHHTTSNEEKLIVVSLIQNRVVYCFNLFCLVHLYQLTYYYHIPKLIYPYY